MVFEYLIFALAFFLAGVIPELTGFGVATVAMSLLPFILPIYTALPLVAAVSLIATGIVALQTKSKNIFKFIFPLLTGSSIGVLLGMIFLEVITTGFLKTILGIFLVLYAVYGIFFKGHFLPKGKLTGAITGLTAGFFGASFNIHGPLVGLYSTSDEKLSRSQAKDLIATYMFFTGAFTIAGHAVSGRVTGEVLTLLLFALPFLLLGLFVGSKIFKKVSASWIKHAVYIFVLAAGIAFLI